MKRHAGLILHPTSLPSPYGVGDLGAAARDWLAFLEAAGQRVWQVLPLHPIGPSGSPYTSPSAFARSPALLSPDDLVSDGWLRASERPPAAPVGPVSWPSVLGSRHEVAQRVAPRVAQVVDLEGWARSEPWADEWALYAAIADVHGFDWARWPEPLARRDADALAAARDRFATGRAHALATQWLFSQQWGRLREDARRRGIQLWGDLPIFVGHQSADVWAHPELFLLDDAGDPTVISGVPPDAFSPRGQRWGHPLYRIDAHAAEGYRWWINRIEALVSLVDCVRLDHFRGLASMWEVPVDAEDAMGGRWVPGLGAGLLRALRERFGEIPMYAEDLGVITPDVEELRDQFGLRGMAVLQFAFGDEPDHRYLPHNHRAHQVIAPGTHDNDTIHGWYRGTDEMTRHRVRTYLHTDDADAPWAVLRAAWRSVADVVLVPAQDVLGLGSEARMNVPGEADGNWGWRLQPGAASPALAASLRREVADNGRWP